MGFGIVEDRPTPRQLQLGVPHACETGLTYLQLKSTTGGSMSLPSWLRSEPLLLLVGFDLVSGRGADILACRDTMAPSSVRHLPGKVSRRYVSFLS